jgi:hypothetical protein
MPVDDRPPEEMIELLRNSEVDPEQAEKARQPEYCRKCGILLAPGVSRGWIVYACLDCDDSTQQ